MRWKEEKIDFIVDAETNKVCRYMTVMSITEEEAVFVRRLQFWFCFLVELLLKPFQTVVIAGPSVGVTGESPVVADVLGEPAREEVLAFEDNKW